MAKKAKENARPRVTIDKGGSLGRVSLIAGLGFFVGVVWPRLAGISLVPEAPLEQPQAASELEEEEPNEEAAAVEPVQEVKERLKIGHAQITSCVLQSGTKSESCGELNSDEYLMPALSGLSHCPAAETIFGTLSLGLTLNFAAGKVEELESGRSTDLPAEPTKELLLCAEAALKNVDLRKVDVKDAPHASYRLYYALEFLTPETVVENEKTVTPASGTATVRWRAAQIREEANREAKVLARLLSGARVVVTGRDGEWYRVKYDARGREGWVHGAALGL